jgi:hypothetical protein
MVPCYRLYLMVQNVPLDILQKSDSLLKLIPRILKRFKRIIHITLSITKRLPCLCFLLLVRLDEAINVQDHPPFMLLIWRLVVVIGENSF